jgi:hypothetical protein
MKHWISVIFAVLSIGSIGLGTMSLGASLASADAPQARTCQEDMPCWAWSTMGNLDRGVVTRHGRHVVVDAARFCRLERAHRIDWRATPRLRGDFTARTRGCDGRLFAQPAR